MAWNPEKALNDIANGTVRQFNSAVQGAANKALNEKVAGLTAPLNEAMRKIAKNDYGLTAPARQVITSSINELLNPVRQSIRSFQVPSREQLRLEAANRVVSVSGFSSASSTVPLSREVDILHTSGGLPYAVSDQNGTLANYVLPSGKAQDAQQSVLDEVEMDYRFRLYDPITGKLIVADVMPSSIQISGGASYDETHLSQHPGTVLKYTGSTIRSIGVTLTFVSRTTVEARTNQQYLRWLEGFRMPFYGQGTADDPQLQKYLGAPPPILELSAYGARTLGLIKVVLTDISYAYADDVAYVSTAVEEGEASDPFPVLLSVSLSFKESTSIAEYSSFSYADYLEGGMANLPPPNTSAANTAQNQATPVPAPNTDLSQDNSFFKGTVYDNYATNGLRGL
jgi:hypothetical protein